MEIKRRADERKGSKSEGKITDVGKKENWDKKRQQRR